MAGRPLRRARAERRRNPSKDSGPNHHRNEINLRKIGGRKRPARSR